jgi:hypothetical protein
VAEGCCTLCRLSVAQLLAQQAHVGTQAARTNSVRLGNKVTSHMRPVEPGLAELVLDTQKNRLEDPFQAAEAAAEVTRIHLPLVVETGKTLAAGSVGASTFDGHCWSVSWRDMSVLELVWGA